MRALQTFIRVSMTFLVVRYSAGARSFALLDQDQPVSPGLSVLILAGLSVVNLSLWAAQLQSNAVVIEEEDIFIGPVIDERSLPKRKASFRVKDGTRTRDLQNHNLAF